MRLPALTELTPRQQEISDAIAAKRGATRGPFLIWLRSPELAEKVDALGAYCRFDAGINERLRELSLLIAARHFDAQYSWNAHDKKAIEAGVSAESVKELANNQVPHFAQPDEQLLYSFATQILGDHFVDQETFDAALAEWGEAGLVDIIGCLGNFSMLAMLLNTFQVDLKPGDQPPFPDVRGFEKVRGLRRRVRVMTTIPDTHRDLLNAQVGVLGTIGASGRPQLSAIWFLADGDTVKLSLNTGRQKVKNLQANPGCSLLILDPANPYRYLELRGDAEISPDPDYVFADKVGAKYGGADLRERDEPGDVRVVVTISPTRAITWG